MTCKVFPGAEWEVISPIEAGFDPSRLNEARRWLDLQVQKYRVVIVRGGRIAVEWNRGLDRGDRFAGIASAAKSIYSNVLGIVVDRGRLPSADARVVDYYPEMMDVPEGEGPKPGRHAFAKDRGITFRHLVSNTSGYMKPGEEPGKVFHYQTYGMNILTHALAKLYGLYDTLDPVGSPGFGALIDELLAGPIGAEWQYSLGNFDLHAKARLNIFGYYCHMHTTALDLARLGWLWCNWGRWRELQIIPQGWMRASVRTAPDILAHCPREDWKYGYGFWTNDHGLLWPNLPRTGFSACGAGGHYISVFPDRDLVIVQNPGAYRRDDTGTPIRANPEMLELVLAALER